jgi:transcriptional regulator with XRE-family HTH domain
MDPTLHFGPTLKAWRRRRGVSQLDLALAAEVSARHVAFLETGRARPSRAMVLTLADALDVPLRQRNTLLQAAGFAALYPERPLDDPDLAPVQLAIRHTLAQHEPYPALVVDRHWTLRDANRAAATLFAPLLAEVAPGTRPNLVRLLASRPAIADTILNWRVVAHDLLRRLRLEAVHSGGDDLLRELSHVLEARIAADGGRTADRTLAAVPPRGARHVAPLMRVRTPEGGEIAMIALFAEFGTVEDITVRDLRLELFFPADPDSAARLVALASGS